MASAITRWRQCIDLVAQYDVSGAASAYRLNEDESAVIFDVLTELRPKLGLEQRVTSIVELGSRLRSVRLCRFLAQDHPAIVSAVMRRARLSDEDWAIIIPVLGPLARSILRRRMDLGPAAFAVLDRFGPTDLALPPARTATRGFQPANDEAPRAAKDERPATERQAMSAADRKSVEGPSEIRQIVERIERFTRDRIQAVEREVAAQLETSQALGDAFDLPGDGPFDAPLVPLFDAALGLDMAQAIDLPPSVEAVTAFTFLADEKGRMTDADGVPRSAVVGLSIGQAVFDGLSGADGQALGAFRRRADFTDARFTISDGALAGEWRLSGQPKFDPASGQFRGYAGSARRERPHEQLVKPGNGVLPEWSGLSAAGARQLIHELRTPLSAIYAYAEMIEGQLVGPVSSEYRDLARHIIADARELVATFDDLDLAGRVARGESRNPSDMLDLTALLRPIVQRFNHADMDRHLVEVEAADALPPIKGDREQTERMLTHLVRAGFVALHGDESMVLRLRHLPVTHMLSIVIERPAALRGMNEETLLDHSSSVDEALTTVPPLGLAFTLRLVRGIATRTGGQFLISPDAFELILPAALDERSGQERGL